MVFLRDTHGVFPQRQANTKLLHQPIEVHPEAAVVLRELLQ